MNYCGMEVLCDVRILEFLHQPKIENSLKECKFISNKFLESGTRISLNGRSCQHSAYVEQNITFPILLVKKHFIENSTVKPGMWNW